MSIRLGIVVLVVAFLGFWFSYRVIEERTIRELEMYTKERVEREAIYFEMAQKNLELFERTFKHEYKNEKRNFEREFQHKFRRRTDGALGPANPDSSVQMFLKRHATLDQETKKVIVILNDLLKEFGFTWSNNFHNVWAAGPSDFGLTYWPSRPDALKKLPVDHSFLIYEYMTIGLPKNNPEGKPGWTGPYFDIMSNDWMISHNHPVYIDGKYLFSVGMDVLLNEFYARSISNVLPGTYNIVFQDDGRLISHPDYLDDIIDAEGNFYIHEQNDKTLKDIFKKASKRSGSVIEDEENGLFLGTGKIPGPGWHFVLVYPKKNLLKVAKETMAFIFLVGFLTLIIEVLFLYQVIEKYITRPIKSLITATERIAEGEKTKVHVNVENELGQLADSFNVMAEKVHERDELLSDQAQKLEIQVQERSLELDQERAKAFQAAKMATLGEISAGIAHEINNPLSTITLSAGGIKRKLEKGEISIEELIPYITKIEKTAGRISKIVKGMRAFSREGGQDELQPVALSSIMENTLNLCEETLKKNDVQLECPSVPDVKVLCREVEIIQTLLNLIQNAIDALANKEDKKIRIWFKEDENVLSINVEDNGPGIPKEIVDKIMNPFFTTKEVGKGTGLGLFISCGLVKSNQGSLRLEQSEGTTKFIITLKKA